MDRGGDDNDRVVCERAEANLVSSLCEDGRHMPVLDLDLPAQLIASSTPGHSHLYINAPVEWDAYVSLLRALARCGIIEEGYYRASLEKGATFVRPPWVRKPENQRGYGRTQQGALSGSEVRRRIEATAAQLSARLGIADTRLRTEAAERSQTASSLPY